MPKWGRWPLWWYFRRERPGGKQKRSRQKYRTAREQPNAFTIEPLSVCGEVFKITDGFNNCGPGAVIARSPQCRDRRGRGGPAHDIIHQAVGKLQRRKRLGQT